MAVTSFKRYENKTTLIVCKMVSKIFLIFFLFSICLKYLLMFCALLCVYLYYLRLWIIFLYQTYLTLLIIFINIRLFYFIERNSCGHILRNEIFSILYSHFGSNNWIKYYLNLLYTLTLELPP